MSAREVDADVVAVAKGLVALGIQPGEHVGIMSRTRYEWTLLDWATWPRAPCRSPVRDVERRAGPVDPVGRGREAARRRVRRERGDGRRGP
ncbi:AMP-binding protein [Oerskovia sp. M15]